MKHTAKAYQWIEGELKIIEAFFETLEEALESEFWKIYAKVKIFDSNGYLVTYKNEGQPGETYA